MKDNTLLKQMLCLTQEELESMSITRQGTVTVKVSKERKLPEFKINGADVEVGNGQIIVSKEPKPYHYSGNCSRVVHRSQSSYGNSTVRITKDGGFLLRFSGTVRSVRDREDALAAVELIRTLMAEGMGDLNMNDTANEVAKDYGYRKYLFEKAEKEKAAAWRKREKNDLQKIG